MRMHSSFVASHHTRLSVAGARRESLLSEAFEGTAQSGSFGREIGRMLAIFEVTSR